jgi:hypothetical protein
VAVETIKLFRVRGEAWAAAPCGCCVRLLAPRDELAKFIEHALDKSGDHVQLAQVTIDNVR